MRALGFLKRNCNEYNNIITLKTIFYCLVRPHLEYCCIIWNPSYNIDIVKIEKVQKNFTRFMFSKLNRNINRPSYFVRCKLFGMDTLEYRRNMYSVVFIRDLILAQLSFYSPQRSLRENFPFRLNLNRSNVSNNGCLSRSVLIRNKVSEYIDLFVNVSSAFFKNEL